MKRIFIILFVIGFTFVNAQFKDQTNKSLDIKSGIVKSNYSSLFGFFNMDNFRMSHTFDISFQTFGSAGNLALTTYTNSMFYKINDQLNIQADISLVNSPYNSFGKDFSSKINGLYLSRAQINYRPTENMSIIFQYRNIPSYYYPYSWYSSSPFYDNFFEQSTFSNEMDSHKKER